MPETACIDEALQEIFVETDLLRFQSKLVFDKQLTRLEHFFHVTDAELKTYGLSEPAIRRLRAAIERKRKKRAKLFGKTEVRLRQITRAPEPEQRPGFEFNNSQPFLIPGNEIKLMETLGEGNFSVVKRALWTRSDGSRTDCAVKVLHSACEAVRQDLAVEISNMQRLRHQNLVQLFGVVFSTDSTLMVIEFCEGGSLLNRLRDREKPRPLVTTLLNYAQQIANGMSYLESRRCVHRDLAARNVLLTNDDQLIKICDFGLTRALSENERLYIMNEQKKVPFSWCPPESLRYRQFSHKSDVWAFGVTMWELYSYGEEPWIGCRAVEVLQLIESGQRLRKPEFCSQELYEIMGMCWNAEAEQRPKFSQLRKLLMDVKFMHIVCRVPYSGGTEQQHLELAPGDEVVLLAGDRDSDIWFGQSVTSRRFGHFPHACVSVKERASENGTAPGQMNSGGMSANPHHQHQRDISDPVSGSFIHTGHGDIDERHCWGHVDHIEDIYLRNPIISPNPGSGKKGQKVAFIPSVLDAQKSAFNESTVTTSPQKKPAPSPPLAVQHTHQHTHHHLSSSNGHVPQHQQQLPNYFHSAVQTPRVSSLDIYGHSNSLANVGTNGANQTLPSPAFEWTTAELTQFNEAIGQQKNISSVSQSFGIIKAPLNPPQSQHFQQHQPKATNGVNGGGCSKYDSSISIPRPNRTSPVNRLTPPLVSAGNFAPPSSTVVNFGGPSTSARGTNSASVSSPSSSSTLNSMAANWEKLEDEQQQQQRKEKQQPVRPSSTHSMVDSLLAGQGRGEDPFLVKDDIKTLTTKLPYKEVHKATDFLMLERPRARASNSLSSNITGSISPAEVPTTSFIIERPQVVKTAAFIQNGQPQQQQWPSNVAIVHPMMSAGQKQNGQNSVGNNAAQSKTANPISIDSLLPPPSELLLSGISSQFSQKCQFNCSAAASVHGLSTTKNGQHQYQPIFNISAQSPQQLNSLDQPRIRYGSNGIPILEPIPAAQSASKMSFYQQPQTAINADEQKQQMITLNELDTDALLRRVKASVDFASQEQCRQFLWRNGFDVDKAVQELKIEKLLEMGLATDRALATSALDSAQWDINAAADRLCCS